jgi:Rps23 Pro-64 3,4-dihydroxylase Tpa1-like proline 4-hydroxylase
VYQSIDLANLSPESEPTLKDAMPALMTLRDSLYSSNWRRCIEQMSNLPQGTLTDKVDCAVNCHDKGCHLLCHDDVIGTRKVSYIIYLTDPEPEWTDEDGGRLELYESITEVVNIVSSDGTQSPVETKVPGATPVKTVLPKFNSLAFFVVQPGVSFHSVQEVFCDRPRLSIQGWYHAKEMPTDMEQASLNQLKSSTWEDSLEEYTPINLHQNQEQNSELSRKDIEFLSRFINKTYLRSECIQEIRTRFEDESSVQLRHFFNEEWEEKVTRLLKDDDEKCKIARDRPVLDYTVGVSEDWILVGPAHKQRFLEYIGEGRRDGNTSGSLLKYLKEAVMHSIEFGKLLKSFTNLGMPLGYRGKVRRFRPGLDYTIAHYGILTKKAVLDATLCFVSGKGDQSVGDEHDHDDDIIWQSDDKGGFECYIAVDDDIDDNTTEGKNKEAEDEYNEEDDTKLLSVSASNNTLSLVYRDPGTMRFVKYLGIGAPSSRWDLSIEYEVGEDEDEASVNPDHYDDESGNDDVGF